MIPPCKNENSAFLFCTMKNETNKCLVANTKQTYEDGNKMSIKKELLQELSELQLKKLAEHKGIKFNLSGTKKKYYEGWNEKDKLVDLMTDHKSLTVTDIENFLTQKDDHDCHSTSFSH